MVCWCVLIIIAAAAGELQSPREPPTGEMDAVYQVLRTAGEMSSNRTERDYPDRIEIRDVRERDINRGLPVRGGPEICNPGRRTQPPTLMSRGPTSLSVGPAPSASTSGMTTL